jgi:hypothetical protein
MLRQLGAKFKILGCAPQQHRRTHAITTHQLADVHLDADVIVPVTAESFRRHAHLGRNTALENCSVVLGGWLGTRCSSRQ